MRVDRDSQFCVTRCSGLKTTHHMFFSCPVFALLWCMVRSWIGISSDDPDVLQNHLV